MKMLQRIVLFLLIGMIPVFGAPERLEPGVVDRDFEVKVAVTGKKGTGDATVVGNLLGSGVRVPIVLMEPMDYVVEVLAPTYERNSSTYLKKEVSVRVFMPLKGEEGGSLLVLDCRRAIDWKNPGTVKVVESKGLTISVTLKAVKETSAEAE